MSPMRRLALLLVCLTLAGCASAGTVLLRDDFTGYDRGSDGHPMWVAESGAWKVTAEGLLGTDCDAFFTASGARSGRAEWTDCSLTLKIKVVSKGDDWRDGAWLGVRHRSPSDAYTIGFYERGTFVHKVSRGKSTSDEGELATSPTTIADNAWHDVAVSLVGNRLRVALDGKQIIDVADKNHNDSPPVASGGIVLVARRHGTEGEKTQVLFKDIRVEAIGAAPRSLAWTMADAQKAAGGPRTVSMLDFMAECRKRRYTRIPRKVLAFYYTWYGPPGPDGKGIHWGKVDAANHDIEASTNYPAIGAYDSQDPKLIDRHIDEAQKHGVDVFISTWWAQGDYHDRAFKTLLERAKAKDFEVTAYWETVPGQGRAKIERAVSDLAYILGQYGGHPAFFKVGGKPVVFVYGRIMNQVGLTEWPQIITMARERHGKDFLLIADGYQEGYARVFDGLHVYNICAALREKPVPFIRDYAHKLYPTAVKLAKSQAKIACATIIPGYDDTKIRTPGIDAPRHGGQTYRILWEEAIAADADWVVITSWNEWHEGSEIEPSREDGDQYLKLTAEYAAKFKATPFSKAPIPDGPAGVPADKAAKLRELYKGKTVGVLPDFSHRAVFWLAEAGVAIKELAWSDLLDPAIFNAKKLPVVLNAAAEHYTQTLKRDGDVDAAILRYLGEGGTLVAMTTQPFPFYYNQEGEPVVSAGKFGFPVCGSGALGRDDAPQQPHLRGWEEPPAGVKLAFKLDTKHLAGLPGQVPFPAAGDQRWRPAWSHGLQEGDLYLPLARLVDGKGAHLGDGIAYIQHRNTAPRGGRDLYVWERMADLVDADELFFQLFRLVVEPPQAPVLDR